MVVEGVAATHALGLANRRSSECGAYDIVHRTQRRALTTEHTAQRSAQSAEDYRQDPCLRNQLNKKSD